jgi:hypothetical protein
MQVWDLNRGLTRGSFPIASSCNALAVSLDGALLVSPVAQDDDVELDHLKNSAHLAAFDTLCVLAAMIRFMCRVTDGRCLHVQGVDTASSQVTGHFDGGLRMWDVRSGKRIVEEAGLHDSKAGGICSVAAGSLGGGCSSEDCTVHLTSLYAYARGVGTAFTTCLAVQLLSAGLSADLRMCPALSCSHTAAAHCSQTHALDGQTRPS